MFGGLCALVARVNNALIGAVFTRQLRGGLIGRERLWRQLVVRLSRFYMHCDGSRCQTATDNELGPELVVDSLRQVAAKKGGRLCAAMREAREQPYCARCGWAGRDARRRCESSAWAQA